MPAQLFKALWSQLRLIDWNMEQALAPHATNSPAFNSIQHKFLMQKRYFMRKYPLVAEAYQSAYFTDDPYDVHAFDMACSWSPQTALKKALKLTQELRQIDQELNKKERTC